MTDFAAHIRIFEANPSDDFVEKRRKALDAIAKQFDSRTTFNDLYKLADELVEVAVSQGKLSGALATSVAAALKDASPAFVMEGHELEARTCALLAAVAHLEAFSPGVDGVGIIDVLALGLWSGLSFQKPLEDTKLERLRIELLDLARNIALGTAERSRQRMPVPEAVLTPIAAEGDAGFEKRWKAGPLRAINALKRNAALDSEEINVLWWVLGDWSSVYQEKLSTMDARLSPLVAAWELAQLLKSMPAQAHKHLILRIVQGEEKETLQELIVKLGSKREAFADKIVATEMITACPHVFPLLNALKGRTLKIGGSEEPRSRADWAARALLECGLVRVTTVDN
jgi:hypothetical protein